MTAFVEGRGSKRTGAAALVLLIALVSSGIRSAHADGPDGVAIEARAAAERLGEALRYRTISVEGGGISDADEFARFREFLRRTYPAFHAVARRELIAEHSLLYSWGDGPEAPVLLAAHQDVVPVEERQWTQPAFDGLVDDEFVWGRGALDDKGSLLGILEAAEHLARQGFQPARTIYLAFGHDEETDGTGARAIAGVLAERGERLEMALDEGGFVLEGVIPEVERGVATVGVAEKGYLTVELSAVGDGGHSSVPPRSTAVGRIARAVTRLEDNPMPTRLEPVVLAQLRSVAAELPWPQRLALSRPWLFGAIVRSAMDSRKTTAATIRTTTAATVIRGGVKGNVLPRRAEALVNFRILPGDTSAAVLEHVRETIADESVEIRTVGMPTEPSPVSSADSRAYVALSRAIVSEFPDALVAPSLVLGMTDARWYEPVAEDVYRFLPIRLQQRDIDRLHGVDERISIDSHARAIRFYVRLMSALAAP